MIHSTLIMNSESDSAFMKQTLKDFCPAIKIVGTAASAEHGFRAINSYAPELVFLDADLPNQGCFTLLEKLSEHPFELIFITSREQDAMKAIAFHPLEFLLKPLCSDHIVRSAQKAEDKIQSRNLVSETAVPLKKSPEKIALPDPTGLSIMELNTILRIEGFGSGCKVVLMDRTTVIIEKTLKEFEKLLGMNFQRVHQSHIINVQHARKYIKGEGGYIQMCDGQEIEVSRRKKDELISRLSFM